MTEEELIALIPGDVIGYDGIVQVIRNDTQGRRLEVALVRKSMGKIAYANLEDATKITTNIVVVEEQ